MASGGAALLLGLLAAAGQQLLYLPGHSLARAAEGYRGEGKTDARDAASIADQARMHRDCSRCGPVMRSPVMLCGGQGVFFVTADGQIAWPPTPPYGRAIFACHKRRPGPLASCATGPQGVPWGAVPAARLSSGQPSRVGSALLEASESAHDDVAEGWSGLQESQQVCVDCLGLSGRHAVRESLVCLQRPVLDQLGR
jgi:hypothetical protein